jgi:hypothetical protein
MEKVRTRSLPVVVERMEFGLFSDEIFCGSLDGDNIRQVKFEKGDGIFSGLPLELFDGLFRLLLRTRRDIHFGALGEQHLRMAHSQSQQKSALCERQRAHACCFLPDTTITASYDHNLPRLIGDIGSSPGWLGRKELAEGADALL